MHGLQGNLKPRNEFADTESFRIALLPGIVEYFSRDEAPAVVAGHNGSWANTVCAITRFCDAVRDAMWQFVDAFLFADFFQKRFVFSAIFFFVHTGRLKNGGTESFVMISGDMASVLPAVAIALLSNLLH